MPQIKNVVMLMLVFKRADGASVIVFKVHGGASPRESRLAKS
jgi:hypothetical protein